MISIIPIEEALVLSDDTSIELSSAADVVAITTFVSLVAVGAITILVDTDNYETPVVTQTSFYVR